MSAKFTHLHLHSHFSLLDGANKLENVVKKASQLGMPALALTDHGNLFGAVQFHDIARKHEVKPIIGCEVYVARGSRRERSGNSGASNHLVLLAKDSTGYHNLVKLVSLGYLEGFYYRPRIDLDLLSQHSQGLICLSACLKGSVAWSLAQDQYEEARIHAAAMKEIFEPGDYYLEVQDHGIADQRKTNPDILRLARELELPVVCSNDCHYLEQEDAFAHDVLLCVQTGKTIEDTNRMRYYSDQFYFKTPQEMEQLFGHVDGALSNTLEVAEKCDFEFPSGQNVVPDFEVPDGHNIDSYFEEVVRRGYAKRCEKLRKLEHEGKLRHPLEEYSQRLDSEIEMIKQMQYPGYFLITWDFIKYARDVGIPVGPGRGSAAGSLVSYAIEITDIDPLEYDLFFERFLNPERVTPPDVDIDFCTHRRGEVIEYVTHKYGAESVSQIITFGTMAARGAIRDVGRGLNIPLHEVDKLAKLVPQALDTTLSKALESEPELQAARDSEPRYRQLLEVAQRLEGLARHCSTHAAGVVIAPKPLIELVPLYKSPRDEITTQYPMTDLERLGLLKMDFLGLTTLTVIHQTLEQVRSQLGQEIDLSNISLKDAKTYQLFCEGRTSGIFQFESAGMREILKKLQPQRFDDLIALNALYRPGPLKGGMVEDFINRRHGRVRVVYEMPELREILEPTYGVIVYQEQVMQIASKLAGFSLGAADLLRRAMGKKKAEVMEAQRRKFLEGAKALGKNLKKAEKIFNLMEKFAGYGFTKSHSAAYALLAYQTAFLKSHYPAHFMAAMLTAEASSTEKIVKLQAECHDMGLNLLPPDINSGRIEFLAEGDDAIRYGLGAIRNVGVSALQPILSARQELGGNFSSFYEFCEEVDLRTVNKRVVEALIKAGAFDSLNYRRRALFEVLDKALEWGQNRQRDRMSGQQGLFAALEQNGDATPLEDVPEMEEWGDAEKWAFEKETLGFYISGHPLQEYEPELRQFCQLDSSQIDESKAGQEISIGGVITGLQRKKTRNGNNMAVFTLEDLNGSIDCVAFPNTYEKFGELLASDQPVLLSGKVDSSSKGSVQILCGELQPLREAWKTGVQKARIRIALPSLDERKITSLKFVLQRFQGACPVEFELNSPEEFSLRLVPTDSIRVSPIPEFVQAVEGLFGNDSVRLS